MIKKTNDMANDFKYGDTLTPSMYARLKGVHPSRVTFLKDKLEIKEGLGSWLIVHSKENDKLFPNDKT